MKKIYNFKCLQRFWQHSLMLAFLLTSFVGGLQAQTYVNGNLSTGATSSNGTAAPAGFTWSEVQTGNGSIGAGAQITAFNSLADDFIVPAGPNWTVSKITVFAYSTNYAGSTSPFGDLRLEIFNTDPSVGTPTPIWGDSTTNRLSASSSASIYRIGNATPNQNRQVWKLEANIPSLALTPGTYWVKFATGTVTGVTSNFIPTSTVVGSTTQPGNNAKQRIGASGVPPYWQDVKDGTSQTNQDLHFLVDYSTNSCSGTPAPGNTLSTATDVCPSVPITLSLQNPPSGAGITFQWQSATAMAGPYTNITGAISNTYTTTVSAATYYQCVVSCGANAGTSTPIQITVKPAVQCYCAAGATNIDPTFEKISNVTFGTLNNNSTSAAGYEDFTTLTPVANFTAGESAAITVTGSNTYAADRVYVWIDFNQNASFSDPGELVFTSATGVGPYSGTITIPGTATLGNARMRVRMNDILGSPSNATPCGNSEYGQVEDYIINITPCVPASITTQPADFSVNCSANTYVFVGTAGTGATYQWQTRPNSAAPWTTIVNDATYSGQGNDTLSITNASNALNGAQYQVLVSGACTQTPVASNVATLAVTPLAATINPSAATICKGAIQPLSIANQAPVVTLTYASGPISVALPDGTIPGPYPANTSTINVSGFPAASAISNMRVKLNITHSYVGDIVAVLKAPNGNVFNLVALLNKTNAAGADFVNTVISSTGATLFSAGTAPFTGTFKPDAVGATFTIGSTTLPGGPIGYSPNVTDFSGLYSVPNGDWTLALYDAGPPDIGTLTSWEIQMDYGGAFAGVWSPATNLYTDAGATIPYVAGTELNTVYAKPVQTTDYSVVINTPTCPGAPSTVRVAISEPIAISASPSNNVTFVTPTTLTANPADPNATYQWFQNGQPIPNTNTPTLVVGLGGNQYGVGDYYVETGTGTSCVSTSNVITVGVEQSSNLFIYPSPNNGQFQVRYYSQPGNTLGRVLNVYDSKGARVYSRGYTVTEPFGRMDVDMRQYGKGVYHVELGDSNGKRIATGSVVIL